MMTWSDEIERRVVAKVAEIPTKERLKWLQPKLVHMRPDRAPWLICVFAPLLYALGDTSERALVAAVLGFQLAAALLVLSWKREETHRLRRLTDEQNKVLKQQHDLLVAHRFVAVVPQLPAGSERLN